MNAVRRRLDAHRWHWQHGPIDIVAEAHGTPVAVAAAHEAAWMRFEGVLTELVAELPLLRQPVSGKPCPLSDPIARRMWDATARFWPEFITPMAAVAGSVAEELIAFYQRPGIDRAWLNNGGDIALHLAPGQSVSVGLFSDLARFDLARMQQLSADGRFEIHHHDAVRGVATSGWRGRSFSMGIADSVTVLAAHAAQADAAATMIANAVNVSDPAIERRPASSCRDDSDLGDRLVTTLVPPLAPEKVRHALDAGYDRARALQAQGLVWAAVLVCQEQWRHLEPISLLPTAGTELASTRPTCTDEPGRKTAFEPIPMATAGSLWSKS